MTSQSVVDVEFDRIVRALEREEDARRAERAQMTAGVLLIVALIGTAGMIVTLTHPVMLTAGFLAIVAMSIRVWWPQRFPLAVFVAEILTGALAVGFLASRILLAVGV
ncbi:hypothetical protein [Microbacterium sp. gxy059]|uniref:hypothetical protein n=1 Tax=Microbacterium sp. gxy059 TaxID=2957199 RepID=UPI003D9620C6